MTFMDTGSVTTDYGSVMLAGLPTCLLNRLQSVLNAAVSK